MQLSIAYMFFFAAAIASGTHVLMALRFRDQPLNTPLFMIFSLSVAFLIVFFYN